MTAQERVYSALAGRPVDRLPAAALYGQRYHHDHFTELTGQPAWALHRWQCAPIDEHLATFSALADAVPFDLLQPQDCARFCAQSSQSHYPRHAAHAHSAIHRPRTIIPRSPRMICTQMSGHYGSPRRASG